MCFLECNFHDVNFKSFNNQVGKFLKTGASFFIYKIYIQNNKVTALISRIIGSCDFYVNGNRCSYLEMEQINTSRQ